MGQGQSNPMCLHDSELSPQLIAFATNRSTRFDPLAGRNVRGRLQSNDEG